MKAKVAGHKSSCSQILRIVHASNVLKTLPIDRWAKRVCRVACLHFYCHRQTGQRGVGGMAADSGRNICCFGDIPGLISEAQEGAAQV